MIDFSKHKHGDKVKEICCDSCARQHGIVPKTKADSGNQSWYCSVCGHYGIGSLMNCQIGDWLSVIPISYAEERNL